MANSPELSDQHVRPEELYVNTPEELKLVYEKHRVHLERPLECDCILLFKIAEESYYFHDFQLDVFSKELTCEKVRKLYTELFSAKALTSPKEARQSADSDYLRIIVDHHLKNCVGCYIAYQVYTAHQDLFPQRTKRKLKNA